MTHILLPAYNEELALEKLISRISSILTDKLEYDILVVDDGSTDATPVILRRLSGVYPVKVLSHPQNKGFADTICDGLKELTKTSFPDDYIVTMDCDNTHDPKYIIGAVKKMSEGYDVVLMSRFQKGGGESGLSFFRAFISHCANRLMRIFFPMKGVKEYSCGYRMYRVSSIKKAIDIFKDDYIALKKWGFVATVEMLIKLRMIGCRMAEVPFILRYGRKKTGSKNNITKSVFGYLLMLIFFTGRKIKGEKNGAR